MATRQAMPNICTELADVIGEQIKALLEYQLTCHDSYPQSSC